MFSTLPLALFLKLIALRLPQRTGPTTSTGLSKQACSETSPAHQQSFLTFERTIAISEAQS